MALEYDPSYIGDIGENEPEPEPEPDRVYEREIEQQYEEARNE